MQIRFIYGDKTRKSHWLPAIFEILRANMNEIAPTGCSYEEDYAEWLSNVSPALEKNPRQIVLMYNGEELIGFFQYYVNEGASLFMMEEIQLRPAYQGTGVFQAFYAWLLPQLPSELRTVEAYAHRKNVKSRRILDHLGLKLVDEDVGEDIDHFRGDFSVLFARYVPMEAGGK